MSTIASFNGGPSDTQALVGLAAIVVLAIVSGALTKSILISALLGGAAGGIVDVIEGVLYGGYLGAEFILLGCVAIGAIIGGVTGGLARWANARRSRRSQEGQN